MNDIDEKVKDLLLVYDGIKRSEIARMIGVHRSRITRVIDRLSTHLPIIEDDRRNLSIDKTKLISSINLNIHEIVALFLSARLITRELNVYNLHTASALAKIALCLEKQAPGISRQISLSSSEIRKLHSMFGSDSTLRVLENLSLCWLKKQKALITHFSKHDMKSKRYKAAVYSFEPYGIGKSIHVLAKCDGEDFIRDFKIERIESVRELMETYEIPVGFSNGRHFGKAWGIWLDENNPEKRVVLKFSPDAAGRVRENIWHRSQELKENKDGSITAIFMISQPLEMLPWIRGWGKDVEVIEPEGLRERIKEEIAAMGEIY